MKGIFCRVFVNKIEDKFHFLIEGDLYKEMRRRLSPKYFWTRPLMYKVVELVTTENSSLLNKAVIWICILSDKDPAKCRETLNRGNAIRHITNLISFLYIPRFVAPNFVYFCCEMYFRRREAVAWTAVLVPSHAFMLIRWLMTFIGSLGTRGWNLPMPDLMSVSTTQPLHVQGSQQRPPGLATLNAYVQGNFARMW